MIRMFAALPVPDEIAEGLEPRRNGLPGARWSPRENLHVTLCFFGEMQGTVAADLDEALAGIALDGFELKLEGVGSFGDREHMRAVWAGVGESEPLRRLAGRCESAAKRCGVKLEARAYRPHLTLAYLRATPEARAAAWVQEHNMLQSPPWRVRGFGLYSSWRSDEGSRYELEQFYPLG
jgi:2'-5' RNA ligase